MINQTLIEPEVDEDESMVGVQFGADQSGEKTIKIMDARDVSNKEPKGIRVPNTTVDGSGYYDIDEFVSDHSGKVHTMHSFLL